MDDINQIIFPFEITKLTEPEYMGLSAHAEYILGYLQDINAKTCIVEEEYIDKDFTIDYQKFYCRYFKEPERNTTRIHFFREIYEPTDFLNLLETVNPERTEINRLNDNYLGFVIIRPIKNELGHPLIGRTMLKTYPISEEDKKRFFITSIDDVSLFGLPLKIESLPFQAQDRGVSACATIALWSAVHPLKKTFGIAGHSPAEITEMATSLPSFHRRFPTTGLTKEQIINYIKLLGLDIEIIKPKSNDSIPIIVKAFINAGLPIIASLGMYRKEKSKEQRDGKDLSGGKQEPEASESKAPESPEKYGPLEERHAVVISGYQTDSSGHIKKLYVHDDQIGPYCKVSPNVDFFSWDYEWSRKYYVKLEDLKIPIYPKIRTTFPRILAEYEAAEKENKKSLKEDIEKKLEIYYSRHGLKPTEEQKKQNISVNIAKYSMELYLTSLNDYKKELLDQKIEGKKEFLMESLPRFLWVIRLNENGTRKSDSLYDTTTVYAKKLRNIKYIKG